MAEGRKSVWQLEEFSVGSVELDPLPAGETQLSKSPKIPPGKEWLPGPGTGSTQLFL
eukprot:CAMPEP_0113460940 /NCGR_PEP_ID=MMETSP0014_2-20120614/11266_1 /TAXON_ID=2857 /ORGANISM="Nitzschia sp." /LENGTH=56 /DNA_ID=CAMNT_0000352649 /DNA_START=1397 /DNA_END=1567 /DNA_ORIENTATION=- /assembly_acc=CAM_ASM_000159